MKEDTHLMEDRKQKKCGPNILTLLLTELPPAKTYLLKYVLPHHGSTTYQFYHRLAINPFRYRPLGNIYANNSLRYSKTDTLNTLSTVETIELVKNESS